MFQSTRGKSRATFRQMLQTGYCGDGGILLPSEMPWFSRSTLRSWQQLSFGELCFEVLRHVCPDSIEAGGIPHERLRQMCVEAHSSFDLAETIAVVPLGEGVSVAELWHGPTLAFKDLAMQVRLISSRLLSFSFDLHFVCC